MTMMAMITAAYDKEIYQKYLKALRLKPSCLIFIETQGGEYRTFDQDAILVGRRLGVYAKLINAHRQLDITAGGIEALKSETQPIHIEKRPDVEIALLPLTMVLDIYRSN